MRSIWLDSTTFLPCALGGHRTPRSATGPYHHSRKPERVRAPRFPAQPSGHVTYKGACVRLRASPCRCHCAWNVNVLPNASEVLGRHSGGLCLWASSRRSLVNVTRIFEKRAKAIWQCGCRCASCLHGQPKTDGCPADDKFVRRTAQARETNTRAPYGDRTHDHTLTKRMLYQLS
jgi:hypothetical protein